MPIVFAPAQPVAPQISAAAGAAEQFDRFAPILQRQQENLANQYVQMQALGQRAASDQADRSQRGSEFAATMEARANSEQQQAGQQQADQQFRAQMQQAAQQHEMAQAEQRARLMQEAQTAELTQREKVELSRMEMAAGTVRNNPNLDEAEKNDLLTQIYTKIDPLQQRKARSQIQQDQLENQQLQQKIAQQDIITKDRAAFMAGNLQAVTRDVTDSEGNVLGSMMMIPGEKPHWIDKKPDTAVARQEAAQLRHEDRVADHNRKRAEYAVNLRQKIAHDFDKQMADEAKEGRPRPQVVAAREGNIQEEFSAAMKIYDSTNPPPKMAGGQGSTPNIGGPEGSQPDEKPFQYTNPETQSIPQRKAVQALLAPVDEVVASAAPKEVKEKAFIASQKAGKLLGEFGSAAAMRTKDPVKYAQFMDQLNEIDAAIQKSKQTAPGASNVQPGRGNLGPAPLQSAENSVRNSVQMLNAAASAAGINVDDLFPKGASPTKAANAVSGAVKNSVEMLKVAAAAAGFDPSPAGLRRLLGLN